MLKNKVFGQVEGGMMLSTEYRGSIERRFHVICKTGLCNKACNYYRDKKRKEKHKISFEYLQDNTPFAPHRMDEYFALRDRPTAFAVNYQKNAALKQFRKEMEKTNNEE